MPDTVVDMVSKADFAAAQKEIAELRQRLEASKEEKVKEQVTALEKSIASRDEEIKNLKTEIENSKASKTELTKALEASKAEVETFKGKLAEADKKVEEHTKSVLTATRVSSLVDKGVEKSEAEKIVAAASAANDELFNVILETHAKLVTAQKANAECDPEMKKAEEKKKKEKQAAKADEAKLDEAKTEEEAPLATDASVQDDTDAVVAGLANFLSQELKK